MHFLCIHNKNTYDEMFTIGMDGLTGHSQSMLEQINTLIESGQKGLFFSYDMFCKSYLRVVDHVQTLYNKYDVHWCDISESEAAVSYDLIVFFGDFNVLNFDIPLLWRTYVVPKITPVIFYTTETWRGYQKFGQVIEVERVDFDQIVPRIHLGVSGESAAKSSDVRVGSQNVSIPNSQDPPQLKIVETPKADHSTNTMPKHHMSPPKSAIQEHPSTVTEKKADDTFQDNLELRRKIKHLQHSGMSIRKIAEELNIKKWKVEWLLKKKPAQLK